MFSGPLQCVGGSGFRKGASIDIFMLREHCLRRPVGQPPASERIDLPSLPSPLLSLYLPSLWISPVLLGSLSPVEWGYHTQSNCGSFSDITLPDWQTAQCSLVMDLHHWPPNCSHISLSRGLGLLLLIGLWTWVFLHWWFSTSVDWAMKMQLPFNFLEGNRFPCEWEWIMFKLPAVVVFRRKMSDICPPFQFLGGKEQLRIGDRVFPIDLMGQHPPVRRAKALAEVVPLYLLHMLLLDSARILHLEYLNLLE